MSPELQAMENGQRMSVKEILRCLKTIPSKIDGITISGGEPFLQAEELRLLVELIAGQITDDIIIFTGYTLKELHEMNSLEIETVLSTISVLIDGPYIDELNDGVGLRGSSNQQIHIFKHEERYQMLESQSRSVQSFRFDDRILMIGIQ